jgi:hypothetical protein
MTWGDEYILLLAYVSGRHVLDMMTSKEVEKLEDTEGSNPSLSQSNR